MGFRFRKSVKIAPGLRLNFGKRSVGVSAGVPGARISVNSSGRKTTSIGVPGSGISFISQTSGDSANQSTSNGAFEPASGGPPGPNKLPIYMRTWFIVLMLFFFAPIGIFLLWKYKGGNKVLKSIVSVFFGLAFISAYSQLIPSEPAASTVTSPPTQSVTADFTSSEPESADDLLEFNSSTPSSQLPEISESLIGNSDREEPPKPSTGEHISPPSESSKASSSNIDAESPSQSVYSEPDMEEVTTYVWITATGTKYHRTSNCGNTKNARQVTLEDAITMGLAPCSKCY